jgi:lipid II:glycine glycyltransferase (peptidoglycan interpeptide bridge formation enzyme)
VTSLRRISNDGTPWSLLRMHGARARTTVNPIPNDAEARYSAYRADVSFDTHDRAWDEFVWNHGGNYKQSGAWAEVKGVFDWSFARVSVTRDREIVGGAQVLLRRLPIVGTIAFAPEAPVLAVPEVDVLEFVLDELHRLARQRGSRILMVHPPQNDSAVLDALARRGYRPAPLVMAAAATSVVDLRSDDDGLLSRMRKKTRQHIRKGMREGVTVRQGDERDLGAVYRLHVATAERKGLSPVYPERYFVELWRAFRPLGSARVFLATYEREVISALFLLAFGNTVYTMAVAWSGHHSDRRPNELLHWSAIQWARDSGYSFWDFSSIDPGAAAATVGGQSLPDEVRRSTTFFKLGFGGDVVLLPDTYEFVLNPLLRPVYNAVVPLYRSEALKRQLYRLRWRGLPSLMPRLRRS